MTTQQAAWLGRRDMESLARMSDYDLSTVLKPTSNVSRRDRTVAGLIMYAVILAVLILL